MPSPRTEADILVLDANTLKDLEIFESETDGQSLFEYCNLTRTRGGAKVLRERMAHPWSNAERIRGTQAALCFIFAQREIFTKLPGAYATSRIEQYAHETLPVVTQENIFEFSLGAFSLWANNSRYYFSIVRGVHDACRLIRALRDFVESVERVEQVELPSPVGELVPLFAEMQVLLARPAIARVPDKEAGRSVLRVLRLDHIFRLREKATLARLLELTYEMDALVAMADVTSEHAFVIPDIEQGPLAVYAQGLVHPFVDNAVANPVELDQDHRVLFLTGPNMAGKTTYLRAFATALYLAQLGMGVPATNFRFVPVERLFSSISLSDDLRGGISYFRAEALRVKAVAQSVAEGYRVVALMDEPFKGTNVKDAFDASLAILERFASKEDCLFMFSSHLIELSERLPVTGQIDCRNFEAEEGAGRLRFDYTLRPGVSSQRLGMRVLREEGVFDLLDKRPTRE